MTEEIRIHADVLFAIVPEWLLYSDVSDRAVRLYAVLARHADQYTKEGHPSRRRLAELTRCSLDSVDRATKELIAVGAVTVEYRENPGTKERSSNNYVVHIQSRKVAAPVRPPSRKTAPT